MGTFNNYKEGNVFNTQFNVTEAVTSSQSNNTLVAAPGAGLSIYVTDVIFGTLNTATLSLQDEDDNAVIATLYAATAGSFQVSLKTPVKLTANKALEWDSTVSGSIAHNVTVCGYIAP